jgi:hypothetical protein
MPKALKRLAVALPTAVALALAYYVLSGAAQRHADALRLLLALPELAQAQDEVGRTSVLIPSAGRLVAADLYRPAAPRAAVVLVHGAVNAGKDDPRLVGLARMLRRGGFAVLVPDVANLRKLRLRAGDAPLLVDAARFLEARVSQLPLGMAAVSVAAGPAILAALSPALNDRLDFLVLIGGYYDLPRALTYLTTGTYPGAESALRPPSARGRWIFAASNLDLLEQASDRAAFSAIAERRLADPSAAIDDLTPPLGVQGQALLAFLENRDPGRAGALMSRLPDPIREEIDALDLARRNLGGLRARSILIHGKDDPIFPYPESLALARALPAGSARVFVLAGMQHVEATTAGIDAFQAWRALNALLALRSPE